MRVYLVRHGEVVPNRPEAFYGGTEVPLSPRGEDEARAAGVLLSARPLEAVYCSPLSRARFGAEQVAAHHAGAPQIVVDAFREIDRGAWVDRTPAELAQERPGELEAHDQDPERWREHGGESLGDLRDRVLGGFAWMVADAARADRSEVAVVSHLWPTRAILAAASELPLQAWRELRIPTASISLVELHAQRWRVAWSGISPSEGTLP